MISGMSPHVVFFLVLLSCSSIGSSNAAGEPKIRCREADRRALLKIKDDLHEIKAGFLSSWGVGDDKRECCEWYGVRCANNSGHVVALVLSPSTDDYSFRLPYDVRFLRGNISPSLRELNHLTYLDLSMINFEGHSIPSFIGSFTKLRYLNLSYTEMSGEIPHQLGNLSSLQVLDLGYNYGLRTKNVEWIFHLSSLRMLDLTYTNMSQATEWMQIVNKLPYLNNLQLGESNLPSVVPSSLSLVNTSSSLSVLDLSNNRLTVSIYQWLFSFSRGLVHLDLFSNKLEGSIPEALLNASTLEYLSLGANNIGGFLPKSLGNMTSLVHLDLSLNEFEGSIPEALGNLTALRYLNLGSNIRLEGEFPKSIWNLCMLRELYARENNLSKLNLPENIESFSTCTRYSLEVLDFTWNQIMGLFPNLSLFSSLKELSLFSNQFSGTVPESIGQLSQLENLDISGNSFKGVISEAHFSNLSKLSQLSFSGNSLIFNISSDWIPPFQLDSIDLASCKLGRQFPKWLQTQKNYSQLHISNSGISESIPYWFWDNLSPKIFSLDLSNNQIYGSIPNSPIEIAGYPAIDLSSNELEGPIPLFLLKVGSLNLSTNGFSKLDSLCDITDDVQTSFLDISFNQLSGELPDCWTHFRSLEVLVLANNKLSGQIPISIGSLTEIEALHLGNNFFTNEIPDSLKSCTKLTTFDVGENRLSGPIPTWMGETLSNLTVLSLRSNRLSGNIPSHLCHLRHLQLLDLSLNNFSGRILKCFGHFSAMKKSVESQDTWDTSISHTYSYNSGGAYVYTSYEDELKFIWKGTLSRFSITLGLVKGIDLSSNRLMGEIPTEITELIQLVFLNVSRNNLSGQIPSKIGKLTLLDALDLSNNQLSSGIPSSLTEVARLGVLDLSNNNLSGKIPTGTQLQSFEASSYTGNPELCGAPLLKRCPGDEPAVSTAPPARDEEEDQDKFVTRGFYVTLGLGFVVGFWGVCGSLIFSKTWRYSYFNFLSDVNDWIYVTVAVHKAKLLRMIKN